MVELHQRLQYWDSDAVNRAVKLSQAPVATSGVVNARSVNDGKVI